MSFHRFGLQGRSTTQSVRNLTEGNLYLQIARFALPVLFSQVFQQLYNTADTFIVGRFLGTEALAAVSSSGTLIFLLISFFDGLSMGAGVLISRYFGAEEHMRVDRAIHTTMAFGVLSGIFLTVIGVALTPTFLVWMKTDSAVLPQAIEYFRFYFAGIAAMILYNACRGIMTALGDSRRPLYYLVFSSLLNVGLDLLFVAVFRWGVWSAAAATVISQTASVALCMMHLCRKDIPYPMQFRRIRLHWNTLREIIRYGLPSGVQNSVISLANVIVQTQINTFGKFAMAAYGTHSKIEGFALLPILSFSMSISTFISQNLGARQYERAKKGARFGIFVAITIAELTGAAIYRFSPQLIALFDSTPDVVAYGTLQERTVALFYFLLAFSHVVAAICRGAGKPVMPMLTMLCVWCVLRIAYILAVMRVFGEIRYIYWAYPITWAISSVIYLVYYLCSDWVHGFEEKQRKYT